MVYFNKIKDNLNSIVPFFNKVRRLSTSEKSDIVIKTVFAATAAGIISSKLLPGCYVLTIILITKAAVTYFLAKRHFGALDVRDHYELFKEKNVELHTMVRRKPDLTDDQVFQAREAFKEEFSEEIEQCKEQIKILKANLKKYNTDIRNYTKKLKFEKNKIEGILRKLSKTPENGRTPEDEKQMQKCTERLSEIENELREVSDPQQKALYRAEIEKYQDLIPK